MGHRQRGPGISRPLLVAGLRQGLRLAREHRLSDLGWLTEAAFAYTDDSAWEPLSPPASAASQGAVDPGLDTPADALAELLSAITRRQHEHRQRTTDRLTAVLDTHLLPAELTELAWYYRAKAHKDLARNDDTRTGMQHVADTGGRLAPKALRGLANLTRLAGDFPTALAAVPALGWEGRHHRVLGDINSGATPTPTRPSLHSKPAASKPSSAEPSVNAPRSSSAPPWPSPSPTRSAPTTNSFSPTSSWTASTSAPTAFWPTSPH